MTDPKTLADEIGNEPVHPCERDGSQCKGLTIRQHIEIEMLKAVIRSEGVATTSGHLEGQTCRAEAVAQSLLMSMARRDERPRTAEGGGD